MEQHYRRLVWAVLAVGVLVVAGVGWGSLHGGPRSTVIAAAPRALDLPAGAADAGAATAAVAAGVAAARETLQYRQALPDKRICLVERWVADHQFEPLVGLPREIRPVRSRVLWKLPGR